MEPLRERATTALRAAQRERDKVAVSALRTLLAALANAEAQPTTAAAGAAEHSPKGVGVTEAPRRELSEDDQRGVVRAEVDDYEHSADTVAAHGEVETADRLRTQAQVLRRLLD